ASPMAAFYMKPYACIGDSVSIALSYIGLGITDYTWDFDGGTVVVANSNHGGPYKVVWYNKGIYIVSLSVISNSDCPSRTVKDTIDVHPLPDAQIASVQPLHGKSNICMGDSVLLSALNNSYEDNYVWAPAHFFDQNNKPNITGRIEIPGYVTLTVSDPFGCTASDSVLINPQTCCNIVFPNAFTPNGDLYNNVFRPITLGNHKLHVFRIVNRWGQTVYESVDERAAWDGTLNGVPQDIGVYYYYLRYDCDGKTMEEKGDVNLIR
ncbi:MAG: gliding motility-associated C-terminal domain-containing protein, partial [Chitinophagales bacterium]